MVLNRVSASVAAASSSFPAIDVTRLRPERVRERLKSTTKWLPAVVVSL